LVAGGYRAIDSLRLEKGYRVWAADITPNDTPYQAGLGFCVRSDKPFLGAEALAGDAEPDRRLRCIVLEEPRSVALGNEPVRVDGQVRGRVTSGGYGYTVGRSIAYAYLPAGVDVGTPVEIDIFGEWIRGTVAREPLFDPRGERVRIQFPEL
jgi:4-methylaminobutanoate oxidase (formaldehyde-forming)